MTYQQPDGVIEIFIVHGFGYAFCTEPFAKLNILPVAGGGKDHHGNFIPPALYFLQHLPAIHPGHVHIEHHQGREGLFVLLHVFKYGHAFFTAFSRDNSKTGI